MIDWVTSKILILFYKTDFFLTYNAPLWIFKKISKSWNLAFLRVFWVQKQCSKFQNFELSTKKVFETQKCTQATWPPFFCQFLTHHALFWGVITFEWLSVCAEIFRIILSFRKFLFFMFLEVIYISTKQ